MTPPVPPVFPFNVIQEIQEFFTDDGQSCPPPPRVPRNQAPVTPPPYQPPEPGILDEVRDFLREVIREVPRAYGPMPLPVRVLPVARRAIGISLQEGSTFLPEHMPQPESYVEWLAIGLGLPLGLPYFAGAGVNAGLRYYLARQNTQRPRGQNQNTQTGPNTQVMEFHRRPGECRMPEDPQEEILECR